jgi:hypothetical protein
MVNNGKITVKQAGLAALVAPQVVNHGVSQAYRGTVVLAGADTHVIDLERQSPRLAHDPCCGKVVLAFGGGKAVEEFAELLPQPCSCPRRCAAQQCLQLGEGLFDRIEVRRIGRQES